MARKVNTKFIVIAGSAAGLLMVTLGIAFYMHRRQTPQKLIARAEQLMRESNYEEAARHYQYAGQLAKDPKLLVLAGDISTKSAYKDASNLRAAYQLWQAAYGMDPTCLPALERQLELLKHDPPSPRVFDGIRDVSEKILKIQPDHKGAKFAMPAALIDGWLKGYDTDPDRINVAVKQMQELEKLDPGNVEIPFYIAVSKVAQAQRRAREGKAADAEKLNTEGIAITDVALKARPQSARMHYRAAQIFFVCYAQDPRSDKGKALLDRVQTEIKQANALAKPSDADYVEINLYVASTLAQNGDIDGAVKIDRQVLRDCPTELAVRLQLADWLSGKGQDEAIELLSNPPPPTLEQQVGNRGATAFQLEIQALAVVTNLRIDKFFTVKDRSEQEKLMQQIDKALPLLSAKAPDDPYVLRINGKIQLAKGQTQEAVSTLRSALAGTDERNYRMRLEVMFLLSRALLATNQPGAAELMLQQVVDRLPSYDPARILLAETQFKKNDYDSARKNLEVLIKSQPDNLDVIRMQIGVLQQDKKTDEAKALYSKLPEETRAAKVNKAGIASLLAQSEETRRLLGQLLSADPGDVEAAMMMSQSYIRDKETDKALAVIDAALKAKPDNSELRLAKARLGGSSPEELHQIRLQEAAKISDPLERELTLFNLLRTDEQAALAHLEAAERINPRDKTVLDLRYQYFIARQNWNMVDAYVQKLAEIDADQVHGTLYRWRTLMARADAESNPEQRSAYLVKAADLAGQLTHDSPDFAQSWVCLGQTMQTQGRLEEAIGQYFKAREKQPQNAEASRGLIECYYALKRPADARKAIDGAVEAIPGMAVFKELQLQHELTYGDPEKVVADRQKAVNDNPDSAQARMSLAQTYASVARVKGATPGKESESTSWLEKSKAALAEAAAKFPDELQFTVVHGNVCLMLKQIDQGEKLWQTTAARDAMKDKPQVIVGFADYYIRAKKLPEAEKVYRDFLATAAGKNSGDMALRLCDLLASQEKYDQAMAVIDAVSGDPRIPFRKIDLFISQKKMDDAEKLIKSLLATKKTPELMTALAYVYINSDRAKPAVDVLNEVLKTNPGFARALFYRAMATGMIPGTRLANAIDDLVAVRNQDPANLNARYLLTNFYLRSGNSDLASKELELILRSYPTEKSARLQLLDLYSNTDPPKWIDAERVVRDTDQVAELADDADLLAAEARMWSKHSEAEKALNCINRALKTQPQNLALTKIYYDVLFQGKLYQRLIAESDKLPKAQLDLWWMHSLRGGAKSKLGSKDAGLAEFVAALGACFAAKNETAAQAVLDQMADSAGIDETLSVLSKLPQAAEPRWQMASAWFLTKKGDVPAARKSMEPVIANLSKLSNEQQAVALGFAGSLYMQTPDLDHEKAKELFLQLQKLTPDDYRVYNNLACNQTMNAGEALDYSKHAYDLMCQTQNFEPLVADTYGWNLVKSGNRLDEGINILLDAWRVKEIVDVAYHLGEAYIKKGNANEAQRYLEKAQTLFDQALRNKNVPDMTLGQSIVQAQRRASELRGRPGPS